MKTRAWVVELDAEGEWSVWAVSGEAHRDCGIELRQVKVGVPMHLIQRTIAMDEVRHEREGE